METQQLIYFLATGFGRELPQLVVIVAGILLCLSRRARYPKPSLTALAGLLVLLVVHLLELPFATALLYTPIWFRDSYRTIGYLSFAVGLLLSVISAAGLGLVIYSVWKGRGQEE